MFHDSNVFPWKIGSTILNSLLSKVFCGKIGGLTMLTIYTGATVTTDNSIKTRSNEVLSLLFTIYCFAKAVHSQTKLRTDNSLFVCPSIGSFVSDSVREVGSHLVTTSISQVLGVSIISVWLVRTQCVLFKVKRYSCAFPLRNKLSAEDRSFKIHHWTCRKVNVWSLLYIFHLVLITVQF